MHRRRTSSVQSLVQAAAKLERDQLEELCHAIAALLSAVDAQPPTPDAASSTPPQTGQGSRGGAHIVWKTIRGYGPYPYLRFRQGKKYKSYYLKELAAANQPQS